MQGLILTSKGSNETCKSIHANSMIPITYKVLFSVCWNPQEHSDSKGILDPATGLLLGYFLKKNLAHYIKIRQPYLTDWRLVWQSCNYLKEQQIEEVANTRICTIAVSSINFRAWDHAEGKSHSKCIPCLLITLLTKYFNINKMKL